jgi:hypothetical protein
VLAEVEDHLRESAREVGEEEALARFGPAGLLVVGPLQVAVAVAGLALFARAARSSAD